MTIKTIICHLDGSQEIVEREVDESCFAIQEEEPEGGNADTEAETSK